MDTKTSSTGDSHVCLHFKAKGLCALRQTHFTPSFPHLQQEKVKFSDLPSLGPRPVTVPHYPQAMKDA